VEKNITRDFYNNHAEELINQYDHAKVVQLHSLFSKYIRIDNVVLDIGFGSGRDLREISKITPNIFGIDACEKFIKNAEQNITLQGRVTKSILPDIIIDGFKINVDSFDVIVSIAVLMHLDMKEIEQTIEKMKSILTMNGIVIISYSLKRKHIDDRHFEPLTREIIRDIFRKFGFIKIDESQNNDGMNRKIEWVIQVYRVD